MLRARHSAKSFPTQTGKDRTLTASVRTRGPLNLEARFQDIQGVALAWWHETIPGSYLHIGRNSSAWAHDTARSSPFDIQHSCTFQAFLKSFTAASGGLKVTH